MNDALLNEVLEANQTTAAENKSLKEHIARIEAKNQALEEHNGIVMAKIRQFESVEANNQALEAENQRLRIDLNNAAIEIERLRSIIRRNPLPQTVDSLIKELQSTNAFLKDELNDTKIQTMKAMRLMARNLDQAKQERVLINQENEVLRANQEIHMGVIDDLKGEILQEKMEKNQIEKQCKNTTALFASFEPQPHQEPIVMECLLIPAPATGYLDNYRNTTHC